MFKLKYCRQFTENVRLQIDAMQYTHYTLR